MDKLQILFSEEKVTPALMIPPGTFSYLEEFSIYECLNIRKLFALGVLLNLANLKQITVWQCLQLDEIIAGPEASDEVDKKKICRNIPLIEEIEIMVFTKVDDHL